MSSKPRNEESYYTDIKESFQHDMEINLSAYSNHKLRVFTKIGELKKGLQELICDEPICSCLKDYENNIPPLNLDLFAVVTDGVTFEIIIIEVKAVSSMGLKECSQLIGYCIVSSAKYGILVNVDGGISNRLYNLTYEGSKITDFNQLENDEIIEHKMGIMTWNSCTNNFEYLERGPIKTIPELCLQIAQRFEYL